MAAHYAIVVVALSLLAAKPRDTSGLSRDTAPQVDTSSKPAASQQAKVNDLVARANKAKAKGDWREAEKLAGQALKIAPGHPVALQIVQASQQQQLKKE